MDENVISFPITGAVIEVHRELGPGLPEAVCQEALALELAARGIPFEREKPVRVTYNGTLLQSSFRLDFLVGGKVVVECKAVEEVSPVHEAQILCYLKLTDLKLGILVNFNVTKAKDGIYRRAMKL